MRESAKAESLTLANRGRNDSEGWLGPLKGPTPRIASSEPVLKPNTPVVLIVVEGLAIPTLHIAQPRAHGRGIAHHALANGAPLHWPTLCNRLGWLYRHGPIFDDLNICDDCLAIGDRGGGRSYDA